MANIVQSRPDPVTMNAMARMNLLSSGVSMVYRLPVTTVQQGSTAQITLQRVGVTTGVMLQCTATVNITAAATASPLAPWSFISRIRYTDFAGIDRIATSGFGLAMGQAFKHGDLPAQAVPGTVPGVGNIDTNILSLPTAVGVGLVNFSLWVPFAYDATSDLRGAILAQTVVGDHFISVDLANTLVGDVVACPYTSGTVSLSNFTVDAFQHYLQPQNLNMLPAIDLATIYAFQGGLADTSNITANGDKFLNFPDNRSILSAMYIYENGGALTLNGTDINLVTLLANSNTNLRTMTPRYIREAQRKMTHGDVSSGVYYLSCRRQPILTQLMGNVQTKFSLGAVNAGVTQFVSQYESFYPSGAPLPGVTQN